MSPAAREFEQTGYELLHAPPPVVEHQVVLPVDESRLHRSAAGRQPLERQRGVQAAKATAEHHHPRVLHAGGRTCSSPVPSSDPIWWTSVSC